MRILRPFRRRDFAVLWAGQATSMVGDGLFAVALPFLALSIDDRPGGLSVVLLAWSVGLVGFLLAGGVVADRFERRAVLIGADVLRMGAVAAMGALDAAGLLGLGGLAALALVYGAGEAFFRPAFGALVPAIVPAEELVQANAVQAFVLPLTMRFAGPALGGALVAAFGAGSTLLVDAGTFLASLVCVLALRVRARPGGAPARALGELRDGWRYMRAQPWLWATLCAAAFALLLSYGPQEVLLPYLVRNVLHAGAGGYGAVLAASGVGAMAAALVMGQRGVPRRAVPFIYGAWTLTGLALVAWGVATATWQLAVAGAVGGGLSVAGQVVWGTLVQTRVPGPMLGRVTSLDWLVSVGLTPVSFAIIAPVAAGLGVRATLIAGELASSVAILVFLPFALRPSAAERQAPSAAMSAVNEG